MPDYQKNILASILKLLPPGFIEHIYSVAAIALAKEKNIHRRLSKDYWDKQGRKWNFNRPPFRPDASTINVYKNFLVSSKEKGRILLLGATPELRDLLSEYYPHSQIFLCDFSWEMILSMTDHLKQADPGRETWIKSDWTGNALPNAFFDVVLGDLVLMQFRPDDERLFFKKISDILVPGGSFLLRSRVLKKNLDKGSARKIINETISAPNADENKIASDLMWQIYDLSADNNTRIINHRWARDAIRSVSEKYGTEPPILTLTLKKIDDLLDKEAVRWIFVSPSEEQLKNLISAHFKIENKIEIRYSGQQTASFNVMHLTKR